MNLVEPQEPVGFAQQTNNASGPTRPLAVNQHLIGSMKGSELAQQGVDKTFDVTKGKGIVTIKVQGFIGVDVGILLRKRIWVL